MKHSQRTPDILRLVRQQYALLERLFGKDADRAAARIEEILRAKDAASHEDNSAEHPPALT
jgi:hypothetical protein